MAILFRGRLDHVDPDGIVRQRVADMEVMPDQGISGYAVDLEHPVPLHSMTMPRLAQPREIYPCEGFEVGTGTFAQIAR